MYYVFDVDGTICFNGIKIENCIIEELIGLEKRGHQVIFASARPIRDLLPVVEKFSTNVLIGGNGSIISKDKKIEVISSIPDKYFNQIVDLINKYELNYIIDDKFNYSARIPENNLIFKQLDPNNLAKNISVNEIKTPIKIILVDIDTSKFDVIKNELEKAGKALSIIVHSNENSIDITAENIDKHTTLMKIISPIYNAFGNDSNDVELLNNAENSYFVGDFEFAKKMGINSATFLRKNSKEIAEFISKL